MGNWKLCRNYKVIKSYITPWGASRAYNKIQEDTPTDYYHIQNNFLTTKETRCK